MPPKKSKAGKRTTKPNYAKLSRLELLKRLYTTCDTPACFSSVNNLFIEARKYDKSLTRKDVQEFLETQRTYTIHKLRRLRFKRLKTKPKGFMTDLQVDLGDFQKVSKENKGYNYMLVGVDVLSRRMFYAPVKSKSPKDMRPAFDFLFKQMPGIPWSIFSDRGLEFRAKEMQSYFKSKDVRHYVAYSPDVKASVAERAIRTIKSRLYRYFSEVRTLNWIDIIPKIIESINNSVCRSTNMRPNDVNFENAEALREKLYGTPQPTQPLFAKNDAVRMSKEKGTFEKSYLPNYTEEIFVIDKIKKGNPTTYRLKDQQDEQILGKFYKEELSKTKLDKDTVYRIEKVLKTRTRNGKKEYFVKWSGYPLEMASWISGDDIIG